MQPVAQDGGSSASRRASFMSPTKASLARFNPNLLPLSKPAESQKPSNRGLESQSRGIRDVVNGGTSSSSGLNPMPSRATAIADMSANVIGLQGAARRRSHTPGDSDPFSRQARSSAARDPRASPPMGDREEVAGMQSTHDGEDTRAADLQNTVQAADTLPAQATGSNPRQPATPPNPRPPRASSGMGKTDNGEPRLPSTPVHLGIEKPPERPKGLLSSSSGRRRTKEGSSSSSSRRHRGEGSSRPRSSPLKIQEAAPDAAVSRPARVHINLGPRIYISNTPRPPPTKEEEEQHKIQEALAGLESKLLEIEDSLMCQSLVSRWLEGDAKEMKTLSKRKREALQAGVKVSRAREGLIRSQTRQQRDENHVMADASAYDHYGKDWCEIGLICIYRPLNKTSSQKQTSTVPLSLVQRLDRFLTFSNVSTSRNASGNVDTSQQIDFDTQHSGAAPFTIATSDSILLPSTADDNFQYRHDLALSSPQQLLRAKLQITVNVPIQKIDQLRVLGISPWADRELGHWLRALPLDSEISVIGTAVGRYYEVCLDRAQCFLAAEQGFKDLIADASMMESPESSRLSRYLGRQDISFARDQVNLDIVWLVSFDDDGEVTSLITAKSRFPGTWRRAVGAELDKINDAFKLLVKEKGALEAINVICKLVFPA